MSIISPIKVKDSLLKREIKANVVGIIFTLELPSSKIKKRQWAEGMKTILFENLFSNSKNVLFGSISKKYK